LADGSAWSARRPPDGLLTIPVEGVLVPRESNVNLCATQTSYESLRAQLVAGIDDPRVDALAMVCDSPGGAVTGCFELSADIAEARKIKPIHAIVYHSAFSACYSLASACTDITLSTSAGVGSIGVVMKHADFSQQLATEGVKVTTIYRGARKVDLAPESPLSEDALAVAEARIEHYYQMFVDTVASNRGLSADVVRATEAGLFFGEQAVAAGLADRVESQQQAINRLAAEIAGRRNKPTAAPARRATARAAAMAMATQL
ncbi:S49 family peptidase, partial [Chitinimonas lacunae]